MGRLLSVIGGQGTLATAADPALARERDAFALSLAQQRALEFCERPLLTESSCA